MYLKGICFFQLLLGLPAGHIHQQDVRVDTLRQALLECVARQLLSLLLFHSKLSGKESETITLDCFSRLGYAVSANNLYTESVNVFTYDNHISRGPRSESNSSIHHSEQIINQAYLHITFLRPVPNGYLFVDDADIGEPGLLHQMRDFRCRVSQADLRACCEEGVLIFLNISALRHRVIVGPPSWTRLLKFCNSSRVEKSGREATVSILPPVAMS